jgi:salicylate hydroxylase
MLVIVIGAGIGGLAAALTLRRAGFEVQLFEQASELREVGAGVQISPNATRILNRLGLEEPLRRLGVWSRARVIRRWDDGRVLAREPLADACERHFGAPYYHFHRADLLDVLSAAIPDDALHLDHRCVGLVQHGDRVKVQFQNGATVDGDVVVVADGVHSTVREATLGPKLPRFFRTRRVSRAGSG